MCSIFFFNFQFVHIRFYKFFIVHSTRIFSKLLIIVLESNRRWIPCRYGQHDPEQMVPVLSLRVNRALIVLYYGWYKVQYTRVPNPHSMTTLRFRQTRDVSRSLQFFVCTHVISRAAADYTVQRIIHVLSDYFFFTSRIDDQMRFFREILRKIWFRLIDYFCRFAKIIEGKQRFGRDDLR